MVATDGKWWWWYLFSAALRIKSVYLGGIQKHTPSPHFSFIYGPQNERGDQERQEKRRSENTRHPTRKRPFQANIIHSWELPKHSPIATLWAYVYLCACACNMYACCTTRHPPFALNHSMDVTWLWGIGNNIIAVRSWVDNFYFLLSTSNFITCGLPIDIEMKREALNWDQYY